MLLLYKAVLGCYWCAEPGRFRRGGVRSCEATVLLLRSGARASRSFYVLSTLLSLTCRTGCLGGGMRKTWHCLFRFFLFIENRVLFV
jgi:hypothetical protein